MPKLLFDRSVSLGNLISWSIMLVGMGVGYQKIVSANEANAKTVLEAKASVSAVETRSVAADALRAADIKLIQTDVGALKIEAAVTSTNVKNIDGKISELSTKIDQLISRPSIPR